MTDPIDQIIAGMSAPAEPETGWLIEQEGVPLWLRAGPYSTLCWTADSAKALRFATQQDGQVFASKSNLVGVHVTEHMWG